MGQAEGHQDCTSQVQALIAGVEAEEVLPEEDDPDADFAGAPLLVGGDEDEWEIWCTEHLEPLNDAESDATLGKVCSFVIRDTF